MGMSQEGMHKTNHLYRYTICYNDILLYNGVLHLHYIQVIQYIIMIFLTGYVLLKNSSMPHDMTYGKHANIIFTNLHKLVVIVLSVVFIKLSNLKHEGDRTKYGLI